MNKVKSIITKQKKKLVDKAKNNDYILIFVLNNKKKEKFRFKTPRIAANWITFIKDDQEYEAPENVPQHFDNYEPDELKVEDMPDWDDGKESQSEDSDGDDLIDKKPSDPISGEGQKDDKDDRRVTGAASDDLDKESSSEEEG